MTGRRVVFVLIGAALALLIVWIANNTEWADVTLRAPVKGEARRNPFYAAQRFAEALGARTSWEHLFDKGTPPDAVVLLSSWHWDLSASRRKAIESWVESGGRLVLDRSVVAGMDDLRRWSGIDHVDREPPKLDELFEKGQPERCRTFREPNQPGDAGAKGVKYELCDVSLYSSLATGGHRPVWSVMDNVGLQAVRVPVGRGSVTVLNASPFDGRAILEGDHGRLFVAAADLRRGDRLYFLTEEDHPSLLTLLWDNGAPAVALALAAIALALWRGAVRTGPLVAPTESARRSLVEQIRGTGQFALRFGHGEALRAAMARALEEAARRRISGYARLSHDERFTAVARLAGVNESELAAALAAGGERRPRAVRSAIAVLETARRRTLIEGRRANARD